MRLCFSAALTIIETHLIAFCMDSIVTHFFELVFPRVFGYQWVVAIMPFFYIIDAIILFCIIRPIVQYVHQKKQYGVLVHMKVTLPRNDSKLDNEQRNEKDFHEKIGKAEQLFRALWETRDLNTYNVIFHRWLWGDPKLSFELQFENRELSFVIVSNPYYRKIIEKQVTAFYESAEIEMIEPEKRMDLTAGGKNDYNGYYMYTTKKFVYPIQTYKQIEEDPLNSISNAFSSLQQEEKGAIQMIVHPISNSWRKEAKAFGSAFFKGKKPNSMPIWLKILTFPFQIILFPIKFLLNGEKALDSKKDDGGGYVRMLQSEEEVAKQIGEKANTPGYDTIIRVFASSPEKGRVEEILNGIFVSFNIFEGKGLNRFENRRAFFLDAVNKRLLFHNFKYRFSAFFEKSSLLSCDELATLYHFPDAKYNRIPTIKWLTYKVLPPPVNLPKEGITLGESVYRGITKPVQFLREDRTRHCYIIGKSGTGKSVLLSNMAAQDIRNGEGVGLIDPHGDLVEDVASTVPKERAKDIVIFDPSDNERPMGLNMLEAKTPSEMDRASLDAMEIFIKLFGNEVFGPRIQHYFRNGCLTLMADQEEGATLIDIPRLFIDDDFQKYKVSKVKNPFVRAFWENEMAQTGDREKQEMIPYFTSKFGPFVTNSTMRNVIGQTKSAFNVRDVMDNQKVLLVNLSKGKIGDINAQLLGLIMVAKINMAAMARADMPKEERKDFYFYVDEFQNFATDTFASILSEARKYRLNLTMAHQYIAQLSEGAGGISMGQKDSKIRDAVFGNVGTMMSFKVGAEDAEYLEKEYAPTLSSQDILSIANYKTYIKLNIDNTTSRPFSMQTLYDSTLYNKKVLEIIKKYSRMKYGRKKEFVDAEIEARMGVDNLSKISAAADKNLESQLQEVTPKQTSEPQDTANIDIPTV